VFCPVMVENTSVCLVQEHDLAMTQLGHMVRIFPVKPDIPLSIYAICQSGVYCLTQRWTKVFRLNRSGVQLTVFLTD